MKETESKEVYPLPAGYIESLAPLLHSEVQDFLHSYEKPWHRGIRLNPGKTSDAPLSQLVLGMEGPISWEESGRYLALNSPAGIHPLHEAGAYYLQEPSAMAAAAVLAPRPGETVLDLCAAPGGKSTQMAARMKGEGLLVSNEPVASRAQILSRNMERMGVSNALVTSELPAKLAARWPGIFDRILVDAPCSGEGMFRRHPEARSEWTSQSPAGCALRQQNILHSAAAMLKAGGFLCYSTCTFNTLENEGVVESFLREHPAFMPVPFTLNCPLSVSAPKGFLHLFPHQVEGEGAFIALFQKRVETEQVASLRSFLLPPPEQEALRIYDLFCKQTIGENRLIPSGMFSGRLVSAPAFPDLAGLKVLRAGVHLGEARGKIFIPDHAWVMAMAQPYPCSTLPVNEMDAAAYLRGEVLPASEGLKGWLLITFEGLALGWGKASDGMVKNHYPKGLRK